MADGAGLFLIRLNRQIAAHCDISNPQQTGIHGSFDDVFAGRGLYGDAAAHAHGRADGNVDDLGGRGCLNVQIPANVQ